MPYIIPENRNKILKLNDFLDNLDKDSFNHPNQMNYIVSKLIEKYLQINTLSDQSINDIIGSLEWCKSEFYRRLVGSYEKQKIKQNGDL